MVRANRDQAERLREAPAGDDFYAPVAANFRADPFRTDEDALNSVLELVRSDETWLDIGAGGGRYALPVALKARGVTVVEPSTGMLEILREGMNEHGISNIQVVQERWPVSPPPKADVAFISHVGYDIEDLGPFLDAMEASASRMCVALLLAEAPASLAKRFWPPIHGEERDLLPALPEFVTLLMARGRFAETKQAGMRTPGHYSDLDSAAKFVRQQLFIEPGGAKDMKLREMLSATQTPEGIPTGGEPVPLGIVTWAPPTAQSRLD